MPSGFFAHYDIPDMTEARTGSEQSLHLRVCVYVGITHKSLQGFIDLQLGVLTSYTHIYTKKIRTLVTLIVV